MLTQWLTSLHRICQNSCYINKGGGTRGGKKSPPFQENITTKGPGTGISPMKINQLIGKTANVTIPVDTVILEENIDWWNE